MGHPAYIYQESARYEYQLLHGKKCRLVDVQASHYPFLRELFDEPGIGDYFGLDGGLYNTAERVAKWIFTKRDKTDESWPWVAVDFNGTSVGLAILPNVIFKHRIAGPWVTWIHQDHRRKGYCLDIDMTMLRFGFDYLNLHKIYTNVLSTNEVSLEHTRKKEAWILEEAHLRDEILFNGKWIDLHRFTAFEDCEEWKNYWMV